MLTSYFVLLEVLATGCLAVLNGKLSIPHQFPYHVGLYWKKYEKPIWELKYYCGGVIISDISVLTSANCIPRFGHIVIKAGKHIVYRREANEQIRFVDRHVTHPEYKPRFLPDEFIAQNDLALLVVNDRFVFNEYVRAAVIPSVSAYFKSGSLAGWGPTSMNSSRRSFSKELHYNDNLEIMYPQDCADAINKVAFKSALSPVKISRNQICSDPVGARFGACLKDNGSGFVNQEDDKYVIIGIVSWSHLPCGVVGTPTVYTRVSAYSEWINETMTTIIIALKVYSPLYP